MRLAAMLRLLHARVFLPSAVPLSPTQGVGARLCLAGELPQPLRDSWVLGGFPSGPAISHHSRLGGPCSGGSGRLGRRILVVIAVVVVLPPPTRLWREREL